MPRTLVLCFTIVAAIRPSAAPPLVETVPVPGGRAALAAALGLVRTPDPARFAAELGRAIYEEPEDRSRAADARASRLAAYLASASRQPKEAAPDMVPIPLGASIWSAAVFRRAVAPADLVGAILSDRSAALVAYGLAALDDETLEEFADHPDILARLYHRGAGAFAMSADGLRVHGGRVVMPGGGAAAPLWDAVVGESAATPERFIPALFEHDAGRAAYLFGTLARGDGGAAAFVLGSNVADPAARLDRFRALVAANARAYAEWDAGERPFTRPVADIAMLLGALRVDAGGSPALASRLLWSRVFESESLPAQTSRLLDGADAALDMAWLYGEVLERNVGDREQRLDQFAFGERMFASVDRAEWPDVLTALRAYPRFPMLMLTLERLGIARPSVYAASARAAERLSALGPAQAWVALAEFQGALGLVARLARVRAIDGSAAERLASSLAALPLAGGRYAGAMTAWIRDALLSAVAAGGAPEATILDAMAGVRRRAPAAARIEWEGQRYRLDLAAAERRRLARVREKQGGNTIDLALDVDRVARALGSPPLTLDAVRAAGSSMAALVHRFTPSDDEADAAPFAVNEERDEAALAARLAKRLAALARPADVHRAGELAAPAAELADRALAQALLSLNYAADLGDPDGPALAAGSLARRHDFGLGIKETDLRVRTMWKAPRTDLMPGAPWHVKGSLLGLDVALAPLLLRHVSAAPPAAAPAMTSNDRDVFTVSLALMNPWALTDGDRDAIAAAAARGRARVAAIATDADAAGVEDAIAMDGWRRRAIAWTLARDRGAIASYFSLAEMVALGGAPLSAFDAWGMSAMPARGCVCTRMPPADRARTAVGRPAAGLMATSVPDLNLHVAVTLAALHLPAAIARAVLTAAVQDFIDQAQPIDANDWLALVQAAQAVGRERVEDYVAAIAADGPLMPDDAPGR